MRYDDTPTVPCKWCGKPTTYTGTKECDFCHNAVGNLPYLLASPKGRQYVRGALAGIEDHEMVPVAALATARDLLVEAAERYDEGLHVDVSARARRILALLGRAP